MKRCFTYRIYFTSEPTTYHVVGACNAGKAIRRAKQSWRGIAVSHKCRRLKVFKVERLFKGADVRKIKVRRLIAAGRSRDEWGKATPA